MLSDTLSGSGNHLMHPTRMLSLSSVSSRDFSPEKMIHFWRKPPWWMTGSSSWARVCATSAVSSPVTQSFTYSSSEMIRWSSEYFSLNKFGHLSETVLSFILYKIRAMTTFCCGTLWWHQIRSARCTVDSTNPSQLEELYCTSSECLCVFRFYHL